ncbi:HAMP domain-containing protein [Heliobacterium chlorum]|uniref:HAMP domain-containing protein n=1 Tax=Heliobacterium chlorum TaxID=2698 RepID=A0ABR7SXP3_HELCL|nr:methyl-accepting chemotaxis protein [Heliobacterium chlorum]MBC9783226.1 HAMP domain-containing protein [Heliobacterium chlorum]
MSLRSRILLFVLIPVFIGLTIMNFANYSGAKAALENQIRSTLRLTTEDGKNDIETWMTDKEAIVSELADLYAEGMLTDANAQHHLENILIQHKEILDIYIGHVDGRYIDGTHRSLSSDPRQSDWYKKGIVNHEFAYSDVFFDEKDQKALITISHPIIRNNETIGVVAADLDFKALQKPLSEIKPSDAGYTFVLDGQGKFILHPTLTAKDNILTVDNGALKNAGEQFLGGQPTFDQRRFQGVDKFYSSLPVGRAGWVVVTTAPASELFASINSLGVRALTIGLITLLILAGIVTYVAKNITDPITKLSTAVDTIAKGNLTVDEAALRSEAAAPELAALANSFTIMVANLRNLVKHVWESSEIVAASAQELTASAEQSSLTSGQVAASITSIAHGTDEQFNDVKEATAVIGQMSKEMIDISVGAKAVEESSEKMSGAVQKGSRAVKAVINQMNRTENTVMNTGEMVMKLKERSEEITKIVGTISSIARQTNLLALNAAIEAAHAGEQGRGFAVVAEEVRQLAEQSQESTRQIAKLIDGIQKDTDRAVDAMNAGIKEVQSGTKIAKAAGREFMNVETSINEIESQFREISASIQQISAGGQEIVTKMEDIQKIVKTTMEEAQTVAAATEEQAASMDEIAASSGSLAKMAEELQRAVQEFRIS